MTPIMTSISADQLRVFRARQQFLMGPGADSARDVAQRVIGLQAQQESPALFGLSQRMAAKPTAKTLHQIWGAGKNGLVWTWGQRDTLHLYNPDSDWEAVVTGKQLWQPGSRRGAMPDEALMDECLDLVKAEKGLVTKDVIYPGLPNVFLEALAPVAAKAKMDVKRFAATRVMWALAKRGDLCLAGKQGAERLYARRNDWFPNVSFQHFEDATRANVYLIGRYLKTYGPASVADVAHFFGAKVTVIKAIMKDMEHLIAVRAGERTGLWLNEEDCDLLTQTVPKGLWQLKLLPLWDGFLMGHKDKSLLVPEKQDQKQIWRPGAYVKATVLVNGLVVATWKHQIKKQGLHIELTPLSLWKPSLSEKLHPEFERLAEHWDVPLYKVRLVT